MPVVETNTTPSIWSGLSPAPAIALRRGVDEHRLGRRDIERGALGPAMRCAIPVDRRDGLALVDQRIVEHARQPVEQGRAPAEHCLGRRFGFRLGNGERRQARLRPTGDEQMTSRMILQARRQAWAAARRLWQAGLLLRCRDRGVRAGDDQAGTNVGAAVHGRMKSPNSRPRGRWRSCPGSGVPLTGWRC